MTPGARLAAAAALLDQVCGGEAAERALTRWARANRFAGSKDRAAIRDLVFDALRRRRSALWASGQGAESGRALVIGLLAMREPGALAGFSGEGYAPAPLSAGERAGLRPGLEGARDAVALDYPDFLEEEISRSLGDRKAAVMGVLQGRAPVDLRVNLLKGDPASARAALARDEIATEPVAQVPTALRVVENPRRVAMSAAYREGLVELQDAASQRVAAALGTAPGMAVLDLCAGGGGKTLALAAAMAGQGRLAAFDANPARMRDLPARAARAGATVEIVDDAALGAAGQRFDRVLVDAPCSGSGAWRRNPDQKWRITATDLAALAALQTEVLDRAETLLAPGGRLLYATCSFLEAENGDRCAAFAARRPGLARGEEARLLPGDIGDGFYYCAFTKA